MDTVSAAEAVETLGVSLPTVHAIFERAGVEPVGRGRASRAPRNVLIQAVNSRGAVPLKVSGFTRGELLILAVLARAPLGVESAREVARRSGLSPTAVIRELAHLEDLAIVSQVERMIASGRARRQKFWVLNRRSTKWVAPLAQAVRQIRLPQPAITASAPPEKLPARFLHYFWNADLDKVDVRRDGSYVAGRLLASPEIGAAVWALQNLPTADVHQALGRRGVGESTRAFVANWESDGARVSD